MFEHEGLITAEGVRELLLFRRDHPDYPEGCFTWLSSHKRIKKDSIAGGKTKKGYWRIYIPGLARYRGHRLSWLYHYGEWPDGFIDHEGGVKHSLLPEKMRVVSIAQNNRNIALPTYNTSGVLGVNRLKNGLWTARIMYEKVNYHLGRFETKAEAEAVRKQAEIDFGFHPAHGLNSGLREILYG